MKVGRIARQERRTIEEKSPPGENTAGEIMSNHPGSQCAGSVSAPIISAVAIRRVRRSSIFAAFPAFGLSSLLVSNVAAALFRALPLHLVEED
jgi:hypothetical protein